MITIYTDGSCLGNPGPGGWGAIIIYPDGNEKELSGSDLNTTNNRMELTAAFKGLEYCDSQEGDQLSLKEIKSIPELSDMVLVKNSRLSVQPVTKSEFELITNLGSQSE